MPCLLLFTGVPYRKFFLTFTAREEQKNGPLTDKAKKEPEKARKMFTHKTLSGHPGHRFFLARCPGTENYVPWVPRIAHKSLTPGHPAGRLPPHQRVTGQNCVHLCAFLCPALQTRVPWTEVKLAPMTEKVALRGCKKGLLGRGAKSLPKVTCAWANKVCARATPCCASAMSLLLLRLQRPFSPPLKHRPEQLI